MVGYIHAIIQTDRPLRTGFANTETIPYRRLSLLQRIDYEQIPAILAPQLRF